MSYTRKLCACEKEQQHLWWYIFSLITCDTCKATSSIGLIALRRKTKKYKIQNSCDWIANKSLNLSLSRLPCWNNSVRRKGSCWCVSRGSCLSPGKSTETWLISLLHFSTIRSDCTSARPRFSSFKCVAAHTFISDCVNNAWTLLLTGMM